ncbi:hypothetical protein GOV14_05755 [Candidatus Pacearchaeota archaeon]|nr:hypothetical protein [Candidatus Pacearchaeota archaeon]
MINTKKLIWGIVGILFVIGIIYYGIKFLNDGNMPFAVIIFIGAAIGAVIAIKEIIQAVKIKKGLTQKKEV